MLLIRRSDKFPVGTEVGAYPGGMQNRHHEGKPSGEPLATATVDATGALSFPSLPDGIYCLWASVNGTNANMLAGSQGFALLPSLRKRIIERRIAVGAV